MTKTLYKLGRVENLLRDFTGGPMSKTPCSQFRGAQVRSVVGELDPECMPQLRVCMPQLRGPHAATKRESPQTDEGQLPQKPKSSITLKGERLNCFSLR